MYYKIHLDWIWRKCTGTRYQKTCQPQGDDQTIIALCTGHYVTRNCLGLAPYLKHFHKHFR